MFSDNFFNKTIQYSFYLLFFLVPLVLTPWNYELFEYNKMMFVYSMTVVIIGSWVGKMIVNQEIKIQKTPLDIPLALYLISSVLSTIFSLNPHTSLWGYYSRSHGGLISTLCYILLFYAFVSNIKRKEALYTIYIVLVSAFLVSFYGILERLGIDAQYWIQDVKNRVFSTLGQPNWLGAFINALIFLPLALSLTSKPHPLNPKKALSISLYVIYLLCLIFTNSKSAILAFWIGLVFFSLLILKSNKNLAKKIGLLWLATLFIYLFLGQKTYHYIKKVPLWLDIFSNKPVATPLPLSPIPSQNKPFISESSEIRRIVWQGAIKIWKHYPFFGSGVETFGYAYYNFRPSEHNLLSEWDFLYNKAHNEFLNILACQGTIGIVTYLFLITAFLWWAFKKTQKTKINNFLLFSLISGYLTILITNFLGFSVVVVGLFFFLIPGFCFVLTKTYKNQFFRLKLISKKPKFLKDSFLIILLLWMLFSLYSILQFWRADYYFSRGEKYYKTNYLINSLMDLEKAIQLNPREALYHNQLAQAAAKLAVVYHQTDASQSAQIIDQLKDLSVQEAETTLLLNSVHLNFYKANAKVFIYLSVIDPIFNDRAIETLVQASKLAPTDAKIFYNLGILYQQMGDLEKAQQTWQKALSLKPNYHQVKQLLQETEN